MEENSSPLPPEAHEAFRRLSEKLCKRSSPMPFSGLDPEKESKICHMLRDHPQYSDEAIAELYDVRLTIVLKIRAWTENPVIR